MSSSALRVNDTLMESRSLVHAGSIRRARLSICLVAAIIRSIQSMAIMPPPPPRNASTRHRDADANAAKIEEEDVAREEEVNIDTADKFEVADRYQQPCIHRAMIRNGCVWECRVSGRLFSSPLIECPRSPFLIGFVRVKRRWESQ